MLDYSLLQNLPTAKDLPDCDDIPVDNQLQHFVPVLLESILGIIWAERQDWHFGVDMGIYYDPDQSAIAPDGFLSIGVPRIREENLRPSYVLWEERTVPIFVLEVVSQTYRGEYTKKKEIYEELGVKYYTIYNPQRKRKPQLEVYSLVERQYVLLGTESPVWLPDIGLGIGLEIGTYQGITRKWLYWYDENRERFLTPEERSQQAEAKARVAEAEKQQAEAKTREAETTAERYARKLRELGIDPDSLDEG